MTVTSDNLEPKIEKNFCSATPAGVGTRGDAPLPVSSTTGYRNVSPPGTKDPRTTANRHPPPATRQLPTANRQPPTANR